MESYESSYIGHHSLGLGQSCSLRLQLSTLVKCNKSPAYGMLSCVKIEQLTICSPFVGTI